MSGSAEPPPPPTPVLAHFAVDGQAAGLPADRQLPLWQRKRVWRHRSAKWLAALALLLLPTAIARCWHVRRHRNDSTTFLEEAGCPSEDGNCRVEFDALAMVEQNRAPALVAMVQRLGAAELGVNSSRIKAFVADCLERMPANPYHNAAHVVDVTQFMYTMLWKTGIGRLLSPAQLLATLLACVGHDLEHTGTSNAILIAEHHEYVSEVEDGVGPLESHHAHVALDLLDKHRVLSALPVAERVEVRRMVRSLIHATDLNLHGRVMGEFFEVTRHRRQVMLLEAHGEADKLLKVLLKLADVAHMARPDFKVLRQWRMRVYQEFYAEGDRDREARRPVLPMYNRETNNIIKSTGEFMRFYVGSIVEELSDFLLRCDDEELSADPFGWVSSRLSANAVRLHKIDLGNTMQTRIPLSALIIGVILCGITGLDSLGVGVPQTQGCIPRLVTAGKLLVFFGAHSGLIFCTKIVLSSAIVSDELGFTGLRAPFLLTALHQITVFLACLLAFLILAPTKWRYRPRPLKGKREWLGIALFSLTSALNLGLNIFSISLLPISLNLVIRSCLPLSTVLGQWLLSRFADGQAVPLSRKERTCLFGAVCFTVLAAVAQTWGGRHTTQEYLVLGVLAAAASILPGAIEYIIASRLDTLDLSASIDMTFYRSGPAALLLLIPSFALPHWAWPGHSALTDVEVFAKVFTIRPRVLLLAVVFCSLTAAYSVVQMWLKRTLSPKTTPLASSFNRAFSGVLSILYGVESLPGGWWCSVLVFATIGSISSFAYYGFILKDKAISSVLPGISSLHGSASDLLLAAGEPELAEPQLASTSQQRRPEGGLASKQPSERRKLWEQEQAMKRLARSKTIVDRYSSQQLQL